MLSSAGAHALERGPDGRAAGRDAIASVAMALIILVVVAANRERLAQLGPRLAMVVLNQGAYGLAFGAATALRWPHAQRRTPVIEVGMHNAALGSVLALAHEGEAGAVPNTFYASLCCATSAAARFIQRQLA
jgi:BASS family bile acid:Na+ symporter